MTSNDERVQRYARAIFDDQIVSYDPDEVADVTGAVMAVADAEQAELRRPLLRVAALADEIERDGWVDPGAIANALRAALEGPATSATTRLNCPVCGSGEFGDCVCAERETDAGGMDNQGAQIEALRAEVAGERARADQLAAALAVVLYDAHPVYANTAGWKGGIGGQAMTQGCSLISPPPGSDWLDPGLDLLSTPLRDYIRAHPDFDLDAAKAAVEADARAALDGEA